MNALVNTITDKEFALFRDLIFEMAGIHMPDTKKALVSGRLGKRLRHYSLDTYRQYYDMVMRADQAKERQIMVDLLTTNETYFFREQKHFDFLRNHALPRFHDVSELKVWSAACSSGEEPYSLAMTLAEERGDRWQILATDISSRVLEAARTGLYPLEDAEKIPKSLLRRYCLKGVRSQEGNVLIDKQLRDRIEFRQLNLNGQWSSMERFHVIFLRNVMIYFNFHTKATLINRITEHLCQGGFLIIGHSESLNGIQAPLRSLAPSIYQRQ